MKLNVSQQEENEEDTMTTITGIDDLTMTNDDLTEALKAMHD